MRIPNIYLETTMFNHYFDVERDSHADTVILFNDIKAGKYKAYTSTYVTDELAESEEPKRSDMLALIIEFNITVLSAEDEAARLADIYVAQGITPIKYRYDALHIAIATIADLDYILSCNFQHINKLKTKTMTGNVNIQEGYRPITICSPMEVVEHED